MGELRDFKFGTLTYHSKSHPADEKYSLKGRGEGQVTRLYRAMPCIRGTSHGPVSVCVCLSVYVCLSQVGVLLKRLNTGSYK